MQIAVAESDAAQVSMEASIDSEALVSALYDVFLGPKAVSPPARLAVAHGLTKLLL